MSSVRAIKERKGKGRKSAPIPERLVAHTIPHRISRLRLIPIRKRLVRYPIRRPSRQPPNQQIPDRGTTRDRGRPDRPVRFRVRVARVERDTIRVNVGRVPRCLHLEDGVGEEGEAEEALGVEVVG